MSGLGERKGDKSTQRQCMLTCLPKDQIKAAYSKLEANLLSVACK